MSINKTQYFEGISEAVYNFYIGGYQVCQKWLKYRSKEGRELTEDEIEHYQKIVVAINETIRIMKEIDEVIEGHGGWPVRKESEKREMKHLQLQKQIEEFKQLFISKSLK